MSNKGKAVTLTVSLALTASVMAAQQGTLIRAADLKAKPQIDAATVKTLSENTPLEVLSNDGGWSQVTTGAGQRGWVRLFNVRLASSGGSGNVGKDLSSLGNVVRTGSTGASATTATKGLSKEDLENATPDPAEVRKLERYRVSTATASAYARSMKLVARDVPELKP